MEIDHHSQVASLSIRKFVSICIIGHGSPVNLKNPIFTSLPLVKTQYIVPFGNSAYLTDKQEDDALKILATKPPSRLNTIADYITFTDNMYKLADSNALKQTAYAKHYKEKINPQRVLSVESHNGINKKFVFDDPIRSGVYILHHNINNGIPTPFKLSNELFPFSDSAYRATLEEIINVISSDRYFNLGTHDYIYAIDATCNEVVSRNDEIAETDANRERGRRANARYYQKTVEEFNKEPEKMDKPFFDRRYVYDNGTRKGRGKKTQKGKSLKKRKNKRSKVLRPII
jgi:hypothetical protein